MVHSAGALPFGVVPQAVSLDVAVEACLVVQAVGHSARARSTTRNVAMIPCCRPPTPPRLSGPPDGAHVFPLLGVTTHKPLPVGTGVRRPACRSV